VTLERFKAALDVASVPLPGTATALTLHCAAHALVVACQLPAAALLFHNPTDAAAPLPTGLPTNFPTARAAVASSSAATATRAAASPTAVARCCTDAGVDEAEAQASGDGDGVGRTATHAEVSCSCAAMKCTPACSHLMRNDQVVVYLLLSAFLIRTPRMPQRGRRCIPRALRAKGRGGCHERPRVHSFPSPSLPPLSLRLAPPPSPSLSLCLPHLLSHCVSLTPPPFSLRLATAFLAGSAGRREMPPGRWTRTALGLGAATAARVRVKEGPRATRSLKKFTHVQIRHSRPRQRHRQHLHRQK
jgi:hypothetical protein